MTRAEGRRRRLRLVLAAAPAFAECATGATYTIAREGAYLALEQAYRASIRAAGEPVLVRVRGGLARGPGGVRGDSTVLVVESVEGVEPGAGCGERVADLPLEGTEWVLAELSGASLPDRIQATLVLDGGDRRVAGSGGCTTYTGSYRLEGARLTFQDVMGTRRACAGPAAEVENAYLATLGRVGGYRLLGDALELLAEEGVVARFHSSRPPWAS